MIPFDYSKIEWPFVARMMNENSVRLSRTVKGVSDTSTSQLKRPLLQSGKDLSVKAVENESRVHRRLHAFGTAPAPACGADVLRCLYEIADLTNDGLLPDGRLRVWDIPARGRSSAKTPAADLPNAVIRFGDAIFDRWQEIEIDPVPLAAWAEWELNGGNLHPFYDGCGRISRSFGAMVLIRGRCLLPLYENFDSYFEHGNKGIDIFASYMTTRIAACQAWIAQTARE